MSKKALIVWGGIIWTVDGEVTRRVKNTHGHQPLYMNLDSEIFPNWFGLPEKENLPSTFHVQYVRAWQKKSDPNGTSLSGVGVCRAGMVEGRDLPAAHTHRSSVPLLLRRSPACGGKVSQAQPFPPYNS